MSGASHITRTLSDEPDIPVMVGAAGFSGGSPTLVTMIVTDIAAKLFRVPDPSSAFTVTEWLSIISWLSAPLVRIWPFEELMVNRSAPGPSRV